LHLHSNFLLLLLLLIVGGFLFLLHFDFSFSDTITFGFIHGDSIVDFLSYHVMESGGVGGYDVDLIGGGGLRDSLLGDSHLFDGESWDTDGGVRGVDGHGV